jgi:hypothetical protein
MQPDMLSQLVADRRRELMAGSRHARTLPPRRDRATGHAPARRGRALALLRALYAR